MQKLYLTLLLAGGACGHLRGAAPDGRELRIFLNERVAGPRGQRDGVGPDNKNARARRRARQSGSWRRLCSFFWARRCCLARLRARAPLVSGPTPSRWPRGPATRSLRKILNSRPSGAAPRSLTAAPAAPSVSATIKWLRCIIWVRLCAGCVARAPAILAVGGLPLWISQGTRRPSLHSTWAQPALLPAIINLACRHTLALPEASLRGSPLQAAMGCGVSREGKLFFACQEGQVDAARLLLDNGAAVDRATEDGRTPLYVACENGHVDAVRLLLDKGADVNWAAQYGRTPLFVACQEGQIDAALLLLENGAEVNRADRYGYTPLFIACHFGHIDVARMLLEKGADVDRATDNGCTPLYCACNGGHVDAARLLLDNGAAVDRAQKQGATPLFITCVVGHIDLARLLLEKGAEVDRATNTARGRTPLSIAKQDGHSSIVALLEEHQKPAAARARRGRRPGAAPA